MTSRDGVPTETGSLKSRLLEAALDELRELDPEGLLHTIGARTIARRAGANSPASINHHYGSLAGLADAVVERVFDLDHLNVGKISELVHHIKDSTLPLPAAFAMHAAEYNRMIVDDEFKLRMGLWALGGETVTARYSAYLRDLDARLADAASALFARWGRELRPPVDVESYLAIKVALLNGITVRQLADPDDRRLHMFQRATVAIDLVLLRAYGDRHNLDARLAEMNYYPLNKKRVRTNNRSRTTNGRILRSANELFNRQGFEHSGIDQIAKQADTSLTTLKRYYPTKQDLAVALFQLQASDHYQDETAKNRPATLQEHLEELANFARARAPYANAYLTHLATEPHDPQDPLISSTVTYLTEEGTSEDAEAIVLLALRRALTQPADPASLVAQRTRETIVNAT